MSNFPVIPMRPSPMQGVQVPQQVAANIPMPAPTQGPNVQPPMAPPGMQQGGQAGNPSQAIGALIQLMQMGLQQQPAAQPQVFQPQTKQVQSLGDILFRQQQKGGA